MRGAVQIRTGEYIPFLHAAILAGRGFTDDMRRDRRQRTAGAARAAGAARKLASRQEVSQPHTEQGARLQRAHSITRLEAAVGGVQQPVHEVKTGKLDGLKVELRVLEEKCRLARRLAAMPAHAPRFVILHVAAVQLGVLFRLQEI